MKENVMKLLELHGITKSPRIVLNVKDTHHPKKMAEGAGTGMQYKVLFDYLMFSKFLLTITREFNDLVYEDGSKKEISAILEVLPYYVMKTSSGETIMEVRDKKVEIYDSVLTKLNVDPSTIDKIKKYFGEDMDPPFEVKIMR